MKINHPPGEFNIGELDGDDYQGLDLHASPHDCDIPNCPGRENERKLELFDDLLENLQAVSMAISLSMLQGSALNGSYAWKWLKDDLDKHIAKAKGEK